MNGDEMLEMFEAMNPYELSNLIESAMWNLEFRKDCGFLSTATREKCGEALTGLADEFIHHASCEAIDEMYHDLHEDSYNDYEEHPGVVTYRQQ